MAYTRNPTWKDHPDTSTPITAAKLENIEQGITDAANVADTANSGLAGKANTTHTHAPADVTGTAVITTDTRLSDARTPLAHTHGVTDLTATGTKDASTFLRGDNTWAAPRAPFDSDALDPTYGDDFTGTSLDAKWTRISLTTAEETYAQGARASHLVANLGGGVAYRGYTQAAPAGNFEAILSANQRIGATGSMLGLALLKADDSGWGVFSYHNPAFFAGSIAAGGAYGAQLGNGVAGNASAVPEALIGGRFWLRIAVTAGTATFHSSLDGETWFQHYSGTVTSVTKVGIVRVLGTPAIHTLYLDRFNMRVI